MPTCNITTTDVSNCPLGGISSVTIEIYALGTINGWDGGTTAGTLLASGMANDDTFTVTDVLPQAWHIVNNPGPGVDIVSALSGTYGSFDINQNVLPEDIQICYTVTDGCGTSDQVCDTAWSCAAVPFTITSAVGVPGTEEGTVTYTNATRIAMFGVGPYPVFREYNVTFSNGITAHVRSDGTTANQMLWMSTNINTGEILYLKGGGQAAANLSNGSNVTSNWDDRNTKGAIVTWTFDQPVENLSIFLEDFDGGINALAAEITPEATHWQHTAGQGDGLGAGLGINPSGVYQYVPPSGDDNNNMYLYWTNPLTSVSARVGEQAYIVYQPTGLYSSGPGRSCVNCGDCEIPPEATEADPAMIEVDGNDPLSNQGGFTWVDLTPNGNDLSLIGGATFATDPVGTSGVLNVTDYTSGAAAIIPHNPTLVSTDLTVEAWVYFDSFDHGTVLEVRRWNIIATKWFNPFGQDWHFAVRDQTLTDARLNLVTGNGGGSITSPGGGGGFYGSTTIQTGQWYHMAFTYSSVGSVWTMYVNGVNDGSFTAARGNSTSSLWVGDVRTEPEPFGMFGSIGYFRMLNIALTPAEIQQVFDDRKATYGL